MNSIANDILMHYGTKRHSGRYPWGSGKNPYQHSGDFLNRITDLQKEGLTEAEIAKCMDMSTGDLRTQRNLAKMERAIYQREVAESYRQQGYSYKKIANMMGMNSDSSVINLLNDNSVKKYKKFISIADFLKKEVDKKGMVDVGEGVDKELGISDEKLKEALKYLEINYGYPTYSGRIDQVTNKNQKTTQRVLGVPGTNHSDIYDLEKVHSLYDYISPDGGATFRKAFVYPASMDSKRMQIRYAEEGGKEKDGVIELRRGVKDLSLGHDNYSQVRILVDNDRFLKGMAVYSDNMPDGVDVIFNTNKHKGTPMRDVLKKIKDDPENPFGSSIKERGGQSYYIDEHGNERLSLINKRAEEGDWSEWKDKVPSQFLSKQNISLAKRQLGLAIADKEREFEEINNLNNPTVKKKLLEDFAGDCDTAAVHLYAAALPRQKYHVILPVPSMKDTEVYAPRYNNGEKVALIRYPHGGTFEIPILTVNNGNSEAKSIVGNGIDAVCINSKVAERLSGADFDGDTVMVIPTKGNGMNNNIKITSTPTLKDLRDFDPKEEYPGYDGMKVMSESSKQKEMGKISNLITDMTIKGANEKELARAVRHSMVVIDAVKHELDYKRSERENGIKELKSHYQGHINPDTGKENYGAATLISRAKSEKRVPKRKGSPDPKELKATGRVRYKESGETYIDKKTGQRVLRTQTTTHMQDTDDAFSLVSDMDTAMERVYASYANKMKSLANQSRKIAANTKGIEYNSEAALKYKDEVRSLNAHLSLNSMNKPKERQAQRIANIKIKYAKQDNPSMTKEEERKLRQREITKARAIVNAKRHEIPISDKAWEAIQAGAIHKTMLEQILTRADMKNVRERATPRTRLELTPAKINRIKALSSSYTISEIAKILGVSSSTVSKYLNEKE